MVNVNKLKGKIVECGFTVEILAEKIGVNKATMYRKLANPDNMSIREVTLISEKLNLTLEDVISIFFAHNVA